MYHAHRTLLPMDELAKQRRMLEESWDVFLRDPQSGGSTVRSVVYESWSRCLQSGVNPHRRATHIPLKDDEIKDILQHSRLCEFSFPILQALSSEMRETGHLVTLCDAKGRILFLDGDRTVVRKAERMNFVLGSDWSEQAIGTNAIGTCLEVGRPVQIFAAEHFCVGVHDWTCSSAPIRDPISGEILGIVDVTGLWRDSQPHTLSTVIMASQNIQAMMFEQSLYARQRLLEEYMKTSLRYPRDAVMVLDAAFNPVEANDAAREMLRSRTGKSLEELWDNRAFHTALLGARRPVDGDGDYEAVIEDLGIRTVVREVQMSSRRLGYLLVLMPAFRPSMPRRTVSWGGIVGRSGQIRSVISKCDVVAQTDVPVLLRGESGTGKELFARAIHAEGGRRRGPFVAVNCGALSKDLLASELFGYAPGAFTGASKTGKRGKFEEAQGGTLFLDEIGEMPPEFQVHLLRVLQEREIVRVGSSVPIPVDVRIIAATHRDLEQMMQQGLFREDLYFRLNVVSLRIPPLRERREDIPILIDHFLDKLSEQYNTVKPSVDSVVLEFMVNHYSWPGNVRELKHTLEHAVLFCNRVITVHDLPETLRTALQEWVNVRPLSLSETSQRQRGGEHGPSMDCFRLGESAGPDFAEASTIGIENEREHLLRLLRDVGGNVSEAARRLRVARTTLYRRFDKYGIRKQLMME
jgi:transcriptional regulator of acetoin/glycerol metabolism